MQKCQAVSVYSNTGNINETNKVLSSQGPTKAIVQSICKDVSQGATKLSIVLVAAGIIVDLGSLFTTQSTWLNLKKASRVPW